MTLPVSSVSSIAGILSTGFLGLGALHVLAPFRMCALFGLPTTTPEAFPRAFIYANGGREVMLSIAFFLLGKQGNRDGMKALMYGTVVAAHVDSYVVWKYGGQNYGGWRGRFWMHSLAGMIVGLAAWSL